MIEGSWLVQCANSSSSSSNQLNCEWFVIGRWSKDFIKEIRKVKVHAAAQAHVITAQMEWAFVSVFSFAIYIFHFFFFFFFSRTQFPFKIQIDTHLSSHFLCRTRARMKCPRHRHWTMCRSIIYHGTRKVYGKKCAKESGKVILTRAHAIWHPASSPHTPSCTAKWEKISCYTYTRVTKWMGRHPASRWIYITNSSLSVPWHACQRYTTMPSIEAPHMNM